MPHLCALEKDQGVFSAVLQEDLFRSLVVRERKRTERSGLAIVLLVICMEKEEWNSESEDVWHGVEEVLRTAKADMSFLGWFTNRAEMGLLVPDIFMPTLSSVCERLLMNIRTELSHQMDAEQVGRLSIRLRVYPEPMRSEEEAALSVDPYLFPELQGSRLVAIGYDPFKRLLDILGSLVLLMILSPLFMLIALCVRVTSPGPVIFRQVRIGQMMKPFTILKFRTMRVNVDHAVHHRYVSWFITASDKPQEAEKSTIFKLTNDPRITAIGNVLRKSSLDELPQLWNVFRGEMSLVGPRPPVWYELQQYKPWHRYRILEVKPGITGLWQVNGRSRTTFEEMVRMDIRYAKSRSLWTDIRILLATPRAVISGKGAC